MLCLFSQRLVLFYLCWCCKVIVPKFPTPEGESLDAWFGVINKYKSQFDKDSIIVGHSKGALFSIRVLESLRKQIHAAFLVGAPIGIKPIKYYDADLKFSKGFDFDWGKIFNNSKHFFVYHSDNDPYVSLGNGKELAKKLGVELSFRSGCGHFNAESGFFKFSKLLEDIKSVL